MPHWPVYMPLRRCHYCLLSRCHTPHVMPGHLLRFVPRPPTWRPACSGYAGHALRHAISPSFILITLINISDYCRHPSTCLWRHYASLSTWPAAQPSLLAAERAEMPCLLSLDATCRHDYATTAASENMPLRRSFTCAVHAITDATFSRLLLKNATKYAVDYLLFYRRL